jgi:hypothetical protein
MICPPQDGLELSENDQSEYLRLKEIFGLPIWRTIRQNAVEAFRRILTTLEQFVMKGDKEDARHGVAAGILWINNGIAVNARALCKLTGKSKSYINGGFHALGYGTIPFSEDPPCELVQALPYASRSFSVLRHWTIRRLIHRETTKKPTGPDEQKAPGDLLENWKQTAEEVAAPDEELWFDFSD